MKSLSCLTLRDLMDGSLPGSSIHGIFQARVLEWVAIAFSDNEKMGNVHDQKGNFSKEKLKETRKGARSEK